MSHGLVTHASFSSPRRPTTKEAYAPKLLALALVLALTFAVAAPVLAAGPFDGFWSVVETHPTQGSVGYYASLHQNDNYLSQGFNVLFNTVQFGGSWTIGLALLSGNDAGGNFFEPLGAVRRDVRRDVHRPVPFSRPGLLQQRVTTLAAERIF
jgi:hypothetical protein